MRVFPEIDIISLFLICVRLHFFLLLSLLSRLALALALALLALVPVHPRPHMEISRVSKVISALVCARCGWPGRAGT
ncbi:hypothetical protein BZA05DRAFT_397220 [Tricharina praecox]|uniref:uncharacterized protein n=1 Tax=Tricharina praecox TaxID=43433 RepID=UPI00221F0ED6|nr:uncharacterized protein BZA05DRAFT_397220 [Tricharina praecox]KAI5852217.1 hypothetical protein BZA05DRAFT_397220 [Tricharina praecox]